jgi:hypothetical protein
MNLVEPDYYVLDLRMPGFFKLHSLCPEKSDSDLSKFACIYTPKRM